MPGEKRKSFPWIIYSLVLILILAFTLAPIGSVMACAWIANSHGCKVDEGSVHPCIIDGVDRGQLLYTLGVMGWLMLFTLPVGGLALLIWIAILVAHRLRWQKRLSQTG
jgi:ABC-type Fe3+ transport system permease subunit